jgi:hypothetical protein
MARRGQEGDRRQGRRRDRRPGVGERPPPFWAASSMSAGSAA